MGEETASLTPFADTPAQRAVSAADLAAASDLVCVCVGDDADVEEVIVGDEGVLAGLRQGGVIAVHSTVHPDTCRRLADRARLYGVALVDAPVSEGGGAAAEGRLLVPPSAATRRSAKLAPLPCARTSARPVGSTSRLRPRASTSAEVARFAVNRALLSSLATCPEPSGPMWTTGSS